MAAQETNGETGLKAGAPMDHPTGDTITTTPTERRAPMPADYPRNTHNSGLVPLAWLGGIAGIILAVGATWFLVGYHPWPNVPHTVINKDSHNVTKNTTIWWWDWDWQQCCGCCETPAPAQPTTITKTVPGGGDTTYVTPSTPYYPPEESGKVEQTVYTLPYNPDSYNEVIENSDQTEAAATPTFNQTSTTGSYTLDDW